MLLTLARSYVIWLLISLAVCAIGTLISALLVEPPQGREFLISFVYHWNGLVVATTGAGALQFGVSTFKPQFHHLTSDLLDVDSEATGDVYHDLTKLFSWKNKQVIAVPVFLIGAAILYICGYPLTGVPHYLLWISSSVMFYVGGMMLAYIIYLIRFFGTLERNLRLIHLKDDVHILELENFNLYLSTLFFAGAVALYFAFRGTLTANFTFVPPFEWVGNAVSSLTAPNEAYGVVRNLLIYPVIIFVPFGVLAGFYIRLVLRKIYLVSIKRKIAEIDELAKPIIEMKGDRSADRAIEIRNAVLDLKKKIASDNRELSLINIKDSPSIVLLVVIVIQFVVHNDGTIRGFMIDLFGLS